MLIEWLTQSMLQVIHLHRRTQHNWPVSRVNQQVPVRTQIRRLLRRQHRRHHPHAQRVQSFCTSST